MADAIVPSHNEAATIGRVVKTLSDSGFFRRVIVVDDGSDKSKEIIRSLAKLHTGIKLLHIKRRIGKGNAVRLALKYVNAPVTFLCDADLIGLRVSHIKSVLAPVLRKKADMCVGLRDKKSDIARVLMRRFLPLIGGERAIGTIHLKAAIKEPLANYYGLESVLNYYCNSTGLKVQKVFMKGVNDRVKPRKWELKKGSYDLMRETVDVLLTYACLYSGKDRKLRKRVIRFIDLMYGSKKQ
ncbi:glycosyltransferase family 2 protein [Candidatus Woesearchaeota archaeon]|nr:glycosyltransferase family 2 protein [Candidatus Woesearchaeota archaeon]